jgi:hypothetical protein
MVTLLFECPNCQVCCISSLTSTDDIFALANDIPVCRQCWNCAAESLVVRKSGSRPIPHDGRWDLFFGRSLQAAAVCRRNGEQQQGAIVEASQARVWVHAKPQRIA